MEPVLGILFIILYLGACVGLAFIPATMARDKGYSYGGFWAFGFFFLIIAIIVAACLTDKKEYVHRSQVGYASPPPPPYPTNQQYASQYTQGTGTQQASKFCPSCGAGLKMEDQFCGRCGTKL